MGSRIGFISLGCPKALVDTERMMSGLLQEGFELVGGFHDADVVVVNTCGFVEDAEEESYEAIEDALRENGKVIVTGCMGKRAEKIRSRFPEVLAITEPGDNQGLFQSVRETLQSSSPGAAKVLPKHGVKLTPRHYAYLKISEGCNHRCSFCIIPSLRGPLLSRSVSDILAEAESLVASGVKELLVISQDTSAFGVDKRFRTEFYAGRPIKGDILGLAQLLGELGVWVRMHYLYPYPHVNRLVELMAEGGVLPYLDVPFQHASPVILKAMRRPGDVEKQLERVRAWRRVVPDLAVRSTFIVGFPGESERDFELLLEFLEEARLDRVGCFAYSDVEGAEANAYANPVPFEVREERRARLMALQEKISTERLTQRLHQTEEVVVDAVDEANAITIARSWREAPEIDGVYLLDDTAGRNPGDRLKVRAYANDAHDLHATVLGED